MSKLANVLIISDVPDFARTLMGRWQNECRLPTFTLLGGEVWDSTRRVPGDLAVVGPMPRARLEPVLRSLQHSGTATLCVSGDAATLAWARSIHDRTLAVVQQDGWADVVVVLCGEVLHRIEAERKAQHAEVAITETEQVAALGRYMVDMRHSFNNAMTSLLGNAELLLLQPASMSADVREQIETIRSMALRLHGMMQRFYSLETEMQFAKKHPAPETRAAVRTQAARL